MKKECKEQGIEWIQESEDPAFHLSVGDSEDSDDAVKSLEAKVAEVKDSIYRQRDFEANMRNYQQMKHRLEKIKTESKDMLDEADQVMKPEAEFTESDQVPRPA